MRLPPARWMYAPISGIRSTCDSTWRPNSASTRSRSSRIGSKIWASAAGVLGTGVIRRVHLTILARGVSTRGAALIARLREPPAEQVREVRRCCRSSAAAGTPRSPASARSHPHDPGRLVPLAAVRHRRQVRAVGFDEQPIDRHDGRGHVAQLGGARETSRCRRTRRGSPGRAPRRASARSPGEAVQDAAQHRRRPRRRRMPSVSSSASRVWMTTGRPQLARQVDLRGEDRRAARRAARSRSGSRGRSRRSRRRAPCPRAAPRRDRRGRATPARRTGAPGAGGRPTANRSLRPAARPRAGACAASAASSARQHAERRMPRRARPGATDDAVQVVGERVVGQVAVGVNHGSHATAGSADAAPERRRLVEPDDHGLAALGAGRQHHAVRLDAHQLRGLQVRRPRRRCARRAPPGCRRRRCRRRSSAVRVPRSTGIFTSLLGVRHALGREDPRHAQVDLHELVDRDALVGGGRRRRCGAAPRRRLPGGRFSRCASRRRRGRLLPVLSS